MHLNRPPSPNDRRTSRWRHALLSTGLLVGLLAQGQTGTIQVGSGSLLTAYSPLYSCYNFNYSQQIYLASELAQGSAVAGDITAVRFFYDNGGTTIANWNTWTIYMGSTTQSSFTDATNWVDPNTLTLSYSGIIAPVAGQWLEMTLTTPFAWDGTSNIVVALYENSPGYSCTANWRAYDAGTSRTMLYYSDPFDPDPTAPPAANSGPSNIIAQVQFVGAMADCIPPQDLSVSAITSSSASFTWTDVTADSYDYEVRTSGAADSGPSGLIVSANVASGSPAIELTDLDQNTDHFIYVRSNCDGAPSQWSLALPFKTLCSSVDIPYLEDFSSVVGVTLPTCFDTEVITGNVWQGTIYPPVGMTGPTAYISYDWMTGSAMDSWLFTGGINLTAGVSYRVKYKYTNGNEYATENMSVYYATGQSSTETVEMIADHPAFQSLITLSDHADFTPATDGVYYIAFRGYSLPYQSQIYLDDIEVVLTPTCEEVTELNAVTTSDEDGLITWVASSTDPAGGYDIYYSTDATAPDAGTEPTVTGVMDVSYALEGMTTGTPVYVWVRAHCSDSDQSYWTGPATFTPGTFQIGSGPGTGSYYPIYSCYTNNYSQQIYLASEYAGGHLITSIRFKYLNGGTAFGNWQDWTVYMGNTDKTEFTSTTDWVPSAALMPVFSGTITPVDGEWMEITLTTPFAWDGVNNFVVAVYEQLPGYSCTASWASFTPGSNRGLLFYSDGINPDPMAPPAANVGPSGTIAQIQLAGVDPVPCDALPTPGSTTGPASICPSLPFSLTVENLSFDSGISYQWQVSPDGVTWTDAPGNSTLSYYATSLTEDTWYQVEVTCDGSGTATSDPWMVAVNSFLECYCNSAAMYTADEEIFNVSVGALNNTSTCATLAPGAGSIMNRYSNYTDLPATDLMTDLLMPVTVGVGMCGTYNYTNVVAIFIDYNQNGILNDPGELVFSGPPVSGAHDAIGNIMIPADAMLGTTRMRVIVSETSTPITDPCGQYYYGETEDYNVNIIPAVPCSGTPDPGATLATADTICADVNFTLSMSDYAPASGQSIQWQSSPDGTTWTDITGATIQVLTTSQTTETHYRARVTCDGNDGYSDPIVVAMAPAVECYCTDGGFTNVEPICNVTFADINNDSPSTGAPTFEDFTDIVGHVTPGETYDFSFTGNTMGSYTTYVTVFFDWDANGSYETMEPIGSIANDVCTIVSSAPLTVPASATNGFSRMRVMKNFNASPTDPCADYTFGQIEEYTLLVGDGSLVDCQGVYGGTDMPGTACTSNNGFPGTWSEDCQCIVVDCEGVDNGPALPGTACIGTNGWGGSWNMSCLCVENVGVEEISATNGLAVFPNPASTVLYITTTDGRPVHAQVYDMVGHLVMEQDQVRSLDIVDLATGSYTVVTTNEIGGQRAHAHFVKQ